MSEQNRIDWSSLDTLRTVDGRRPLTVRKSNSENYPWQACYSGCGAYYWESYTDDGYYFLDKRDHTNNLVSNTECPECSEPPKPASVKITVFSRCVPIIKARRIIRDNAGPTGELKEPEEFVLIDGLFYPLSWIKASPGMLEQQLEVCDG